MYTGRVFGYFSSVMTCCPWNICAARILAASYEVYSTERMATRSSGAVETWPLGARAEAEQCKMATTGVLRPRRLVKNFTYKLSHSE